MKAINRNGNAGSPGIKAITADTPPANALPDNLQLEQAVRAYQALFQPTTQPARLAQLRAAALQVMEALAEFSPYLTGAVLHGTAGEHDYIHLQLFADSAKEVEIYLLNRNVEIDIGETPHFKGARFDPVETVSFQWHAEDVHAELYELHDLRGALKPRADGSPARIDATGLRALIERAATQPAP